MTSLTANQTHRAAGVLLAAAAGDALGAGYEFTHPRPDQPIAMIGGGLGDFAPGEWTDDTCMTVAIAEVTATGADLTSQAGLDAVAARFIDWYDSGPADIGIQTSRVLSARDTTAAAMADTARGLPGRTGGNGALMRTAPVALAFLDDPAARAAAATAVSALTHPDPRAGEACRIWCDLIANTVLTGHIDHTWTFLDGYGADAKAYWRPLKQAAETGQPGDFANNGWVVHALQTAWWAITHTTATDAHQLGEGLELAVRAGGDTDTTATIAGALLGACWGASAVPAGWRRILHGWRGLRDHDLIRLAIETVQGGPRSRKWPSVEVMDYTGWDTSHVTTHPHDHGVTLGGVDAINAGGYDAIVSLCRMGTADLGTEHIRFWLLDAGPDANPNLDFVLDDAARMVQTLRGEGKRVLLHCVEGRSRTPSVAARYAILLGHDPNDVLDAMTWSHPDPDLWRVAAD